MFFFVAQLIAGKLDIFGSANSLQLANPKFLNRIFQFGVNIITKAGLSSLRSNWGLDAPKPDLSGKRGRG